MEITDQGCGIEKCGTGDGADVHAPGSGTFRYGIFFFMEAFMDCLEVESTVGKGTRVIMEKKLGNAPWVSDPDQEEE